MKTNQLYSFRNLIKSQKLSFRTYSQSTAIRGVFEPRNQPTEEKPSQEDLIQSEKCITEVNTTFTKAKPSYTSGLANSYSEIPIKSDITHDRLLYKSRKRGILEMDLLLGTFAYKHLKELNSSEQSEYESLLDEPDWDLYYWVTEKEKPPAKWANSKILQKLRIHAKADKHGPLRMPDLS